MSAPEENEIFFDLKTNSKRLIYVVEHLMKKRSIEITEILVFRICDLPNPVLRLKVLPFLRLKVLPFLRSKVLRRTLPVLRASSWKVIASRMKTTKKMPAKFIVDQWSVYCVTILKHKKSSHSLFFITGTRYYFHVH